MIGGYLRLLADQKTMAATHLNTEDSSPSVFSEVTPTSGG